jgi:negative regulator of flagellin synthesis FlgM
MNDVDEAKVSRLQKLIDEGKYHVDADAIADRLVDSHLEIPD